MTKIEYSNNKKNKIIDIILPLLIVPLIMGILVFTSFLTLSILAMGNCDKNTKCYDNYNNEIIGLECKPKECMDLNDATLNSFYMGISIFIVFFFIVLAIIYWDTQNE